MSPVSNNHILGDTRRSDAKHIGNYSITNNHASRNTLLSYGKIGGNENSNSRTTRAPSQENTHYKMHCCYAPTHIGPLSLKRNATNYARQLRSNQPCSTNYSHTTRLARIEPLTKLTMRRPDEKHSCIHTK